MHDTPPRQRKLSGVERVVAAAHAPAGETPESARRRHANAWLEDEARRAAGLPSPSPASDRGHATPNDASFRSPGKASVVSGGQHDVDTVVEQYLLLVREKDDAILRLTAEARALEDALESERVRRQSAEEAIVDEQRALKRIRAAVQGDRDAATRTKRQLEAALEILTDAHVPLKELLDDAATAPTSLDASAGKVSTATQASDGDAGSGRAASVAAKLRDGSAGNNDGLVACAKRACRLARWQAARIRELEVAARTTVTAVDEPAGRQHIEDEQTSLLAAMVAAQESEQRALLEREWSSGAWLGAVAAFVRGEHNVEALGQEFARWSMAASLGRTVRLSHLVIDQRNIARSDLAASRACEASLSEMLSLAVRQRFEFAHVAHRRIRDVTADASLLQQQLHNERDVRRGADRRNEELREQVAGLAANLSRTRAAAARTRSASRDTSSASPMDPSCSVATATSESGATVAQLRERLESETDKRRRERAQRQRLEDAVGQMSRQLETVVDRAAQMQAAWREAEHRAAAAEARLRERERSATDGDVPMFGDARVADRSLATPPPPSEPAAMNGEAARSPDASGDVAAVAAPDDSADAAAMRDLAEQVRAMRGTVRAALTP